MRRLARGYLMAVSVLDGLAGLVCGVLFVARPDGSLLQAGALRSVIRAMPLADVFFRDFFWIGVAMLLVLGIPNLVATVMLVRRSRRRYGATLVAGALLLLWTGFEMIYMMNGLAVGYFVVGALSVLASDRLLRTAADATEGVR
jgi:hypothetical protein